MYLRACPSCGVRTYTDPATVTVTPSGVGIVCTTCGPVWAPETPHMRAALYAFGARMAGEDPLTTQDVDEFVAELADADVMAALDAETRA